MLSKPVVVELASLIWKHLKSRGMPAAFDGGEIIKAGKRVDPAIDFRFSVVTCTYKGQPFVISVQHQEDTAYASGSPEIDK